MPSERVTRGFGLLEKFLSIQRMKEAKKLIKIHNKKGTILDIGCGSYPMFLLNVSFNKKCGIDQEIIEKEFKHLRLYLKNQNILKNPKLPFSKNYFDVITMLAVIEHLNFEHLKKILEQCYCILKKDGILIITTPAKWSELFLSVMAKIHLISSEEFEEHQNVFNFNELIQLLIAANFKRYKIEKGYFEFFLNLWMCVQK